MTRLRPCLIVLSGMPLTGKTTLAQKLKERFSELIHYDVDEIRSEIFPNPERLESHALLAPEDELREVAFSYTEMVVRALERVYAGSPVVVTGTFSRDEFKRMLGLAKIILEGVAPFYVFRLSAPDGEIEKRIQKRKDEGSFSNINSMEKFEWARGLFREISFAPVAPVDTSKSPEECAQKILHNIHESLFLKL